MSGDPRVQTTITVAYGGAHFGKSLVWHSSELLFAYFLTEICGLSPVAMGYALAGSLAFACSTDLIVGVILSRHITTVASAGAWQWPASVASGIALIAFAATPLVPTSFKVLWVAGSIAVFRCAYSFYDIPQNAILGLIDGGSFDRVKLSALRFAAGGLASLTVAGAASPVLIGDGAASRFMAYAAFIVVVSCATAWYLRRATTEQNSIADEPAKAADFAPPSYRFLRLLALLVLVAGTSAVFGKLEPYYAGTALRSSTTRIETLLIIALGGIASSLFGLGWPDVPHIVPPSARARPV